jgi:hypothetical protein
MIMVSSLSVCIMFRQRWCGMPLPFLGWSVAAPLYTSALLRWYFIASIYTGAPYKSRGSIAPLYILAITPYLNPHVSLATLDRLCVSFVHLSPVYLMCSWNLNFWSRTNPKYFIWRTCSNGLECRYSTMSLSSFRFLLVTSMTWEFLSMSFILVLLDYPSILLNSTFA